MYKRAKIALVLIDRSIKTFRFKNLGLDCLISNNKKFC